jgi:hypothetical protein
VPSRTNDFTESELIMMKSRVILIGKSVLGFIIYPTKKITLLKEEFAQKNVNNVMDMLPLIEKDFN